MGLTGYDSSNGGAFGSLFVTAIIDLPQAQAAVLGMHAINYPLL